MKGPQIREMLEMGCTYSVIVDKLGVALSTIAYHARVIGKQKRSIIRQKHDWAVIQQYYDDGYSLQDIIKIFHIDAGTLRSAQTKGDLRFAEPGDPERQRKLKATRKRRGKKIYPPSETMMIANSNHTTGVIRRVVKRENLLPYHCHNETCVLHGVLNPVWNSTPLILHLDHKNGIRNDHRIENLHWLCPNCHSQTETYCGRNKTLAIPESIELSTDVLETPF